jgi:hypothetical protein
VAVTAGLSTLEALHNTLTSNVTNACEIRSSTDRGLSNAVWETPDAEAFRAAWEQFRPHLQKFEETLAVAASDVATNHNDNPVVNGVTDAPNLAPVSPI